MANQGGGTGGLGGFGPGGFGPGGFGAGGFAPGDLDALSRQMWGAWGEQMRAAGAPAQPAAPGFGDAAAWLAQVAQGGAPGGNDTLDRFNSQARGWFAQMQQLATQFAGQNSNPADIVRQWQQTLGDNPFAGALDSMQGPGQQGVEQWSAQVAPYLQALQKSGQGLLGLPTFGFTREHQQRWQAMARAQLDHQQHSKAYQDLMAQAGKQAFKKFEAKLAERSAPDRQLDSARALFDLWIDAAEEAYAEIALSPTFREVYGEFVNSQMRVRASLQGEIEQMCGQLGIPGRTEIDAAHRKIAQMERELWRLRNSMRTASDTRPQSASKPEAPPSALASGSAAPAQTAPRRSGASKAQPAKSAKPGAAATPPAPGVVRSKRAATSRTATSRTATKSAATKRADKPNAVVPAPASGRKKTAAAAAADKPSPRAAVAGRKSTAAATTKRHKR